MARGQLRKGGLRHFGLWCTYALCASVATIGVVDHAYGGHMGFVLLGAFALCVAFIVHLVALAIRWRNFRWRTLLPLLACALVLPAIQTLGSQLLTARFEWNRDKYEALALALSNGTHSEVLHQEEQTLAHWAKVVHFGELDTSAGKPVDKSRIVAVHFLAVTHGFAGHVGYLRALDVDTERYLQRGHGGAGWYYSKPLGKRWFLVAN